MKRISPIVSSIVTAIVVYIAILLNREVGKCLEETYNITQSYIFRALILLVTGICIGWNLWMLQKAEATIVVTSIIVDIVLIAVLYFGIYRHDISCRAYWNVYICACHKVCGQKRKGINYEKKQT